MTRPVSSTLKTASRPALRSPLRSSTMPLLAPSAVSQEAENPDRSAVEPALEVTAQQLRRMEISEFSAWLRTQTNKHKRSFQEETIRGYAETARALDLWMAAENIDGDFTACSVDVLNLFFAAYRNAHSQGGTNTGQRNLHHLFKWLALGYDHPDPWTDDMVRYGPVESRPSTLDEGFIRDLLEVTGGGKATSFVDARDHAMIRMLTEGVRREELAQQQITDLSEDLIARPFVRVVPLKDGRDFSEGRLVPLMMRSAQGTVVLRGRSRGDVTGSYPEVAAPLARAAGRRTMILDGEVTVFDGDRPSFALLQRRIHVARPSPGLVATVPVTYVAGAGPAEAQARRLRQAESSTGSGPLVAGRRRADK
jgi:hypothetical protein